ncbi:MAG: cob(I)yrinic acid a,c-diamide adenosyltransferase [Verrucomicrobiota bacterium]|jgi:cob(I)alamin adenosyltransferase|nr:cob(I)yrinic acid a,c-diamide adenosyltransferase [Verrucomicrobiota bacterium]
MSITTKTGDDGETCLLFSRRTRKDDPRIAACGDVDELNAALGLTKAHLQQPEFAQKLTTIQQSLIALMGELATLPEDANRYAEAKFDKLTPTDTTKLDGWIGELERAGLNFKDWALPGGSVPSAQLDFARTVCRRAERSVLSVLGTETLTDSQAVIYLNRLSDLLWLIARAIDESTNKQLA